MTYSTVLTNQTIIEMTKSGIVPELIIAKIHAHSSKFDTSPEGLTQLREAQVPSSVVSEILSLKRETKVVRSVLAGWERLAVVRYLNLIPPEEPIPIPRTELAIRTILVFARGEDGHLYMCSWHGDRSEWTDHGSPTSSTLLTGPAAVTYVSAGIQFIHVFVLGIDGHLYDRFWDGFRWRWADQGVVPGNAVTVTPGAVTYAQGGAQHIYVFLPGLSGHLFLNYWDGTRWRWTDQGAPPSAPGFYNTPGVIAYFDVPRRSNPEEPGLPSPILGPPRIYAFVGASDGHLYVNFWDGSRWQWADQGTPPGAAASCSGRPGVIAFPQDGTERIYVFTDEGCLSTNGHLYVNFWDGNLWQWADHGMPPPRFPPTPTKAYFPAAITFRASGERKIYVFVRGNWVLNLNDLSNYLNLYVWDGNSWQWFNQGREVLGPIEALTFLDVNSGNHSVYAFSSGYGNEILVNYLEGNAWNWANLGSP
jgi:hypothetical protein